MLRLQTVYISESKRSVAQRSSKHKRVVKNVDKDKNEIADHNRKNDHIFNFEDNYVIDREANADSRKVKDTIHSIIRTIHKTVYLIHTRADLGFETR